ncbi:MAG: cupin domain-containing protein [Deltaproteobacteria bacterium]|nr:cupin domain-containing protein [Deltaproteobacteria bacterium]
MKGRRVSRRMIAVAVAATIVLYFGLGALLHYVVFPEEKPPEWAHAKPGFAFETPTGERVELIRGTLETDGEFAEVHFDIAPGGYVAAAHIHPRVEERFEVVSGSLTALVGDEERVISAGETLVVPPGTPHQPFNRGDVEMRSIARITPPGNGDIFFGQLSGLDFKPSFLQMMLFVRAYDAYPASPAPAVVGTLSFLLAPTARLVGYRSFYPEYAERFLRGAAQGDAADPRTNREGSTRALGGAGR